MPNPCCRQSTIVKNRIESIFVNGFCVSDIFDENLIRESKKIYNLLSYLSENIKIIGKLPFTRWLSVL